MMVLKPTFCTLAYWIDEHDQMVCVSENWLNSARANGAPHLTPEAALYRPLWEFVSNHETQVFYRALLERVRAGNWSVSLPFRSDSPTVVRFLELRLSPTSEGLIRFDTHVLEELGREYNPLLDATVVRSDDFITLCSWCKKVETGLGRWQEVEDASVSLNLIDVLPLPSLTHGVCADCQEMLERALARLSRRRQRPSVLQPA